MPGRTAKTEIGTNRSGKSATILLLGSEPVGQAAIREVLEGAGYLVLSANNLGTAVTMLADCPADLLITHPYIAEIPGHEAAKYLRTKKAGMPVLLVAGLLDDDRLLNMATLERLETSSILHRGSACSKSAGCIKGRIVPDMEIKRSAILVPKQRLMAFLFTLLLILYAPHPGNAAVGECRGLSGAVVKNDLVRLKSILESGCNPNPSAGLNPLQLALAGGQVEATRLLLDAGADPNAKVGQGLPVVHWLGSGRHYTDDNLLQVAKLLERHQCNFEDRGSPKRVDLLTNLASRRVPKTLAFLATKPQVGDPTRALKAIARGNDADSIKVLLNAGADPLAGTVKRGPPMPPVQKSALSACQPRELTPDMKALLQKMGLPNASGLVGLAGGMTCKLIQQCGDMIYIDCNSAADGSAYYINQASGQLLATCGGACMRGCTNCPPKEWTCTCDAK